MKASSVKVDEFNKFYLEKLSERGVQGTREYHYLDISIDSRDGHIWKVTFDAKHPSRVLEASTMMDYDGDVLQLAEHLLNERLSERRSGAQ